VRYHHKLAADLAQVICPPYDVISSDEQAALQAQSPYNTVWLELPADEAGAPGSRYDAAAKHLNEWRQAGVLHADPRPAYYLHETEFQHTGQTFRRQDLIASLAVEPWSSGAVLPHERTMAGPKADRLALTRATQLNVSPIWVLQRDRLPELQQAWALAEQTEPAADFAWRGERHRLWVIDDHLTLTAIQIAFETGGPLYIADGHHRYETALAYRAEAEQKAPGATGILAVITSAEDPGLLVLPTHRLLRGLDSKLTLEEAETRWSDVLHTEYFPVWEQAPPEQIDALMQQLASNGRSSPSFGLLGLGHLDLFALLELRGRRIPEERLPADRSQAWKALDVSLLHTLLVDPLIAETGRPREEVLSFTRDPHEAFGLVRQGEASAAFFLNPTPVQGVLGVADAGDRMPEKSTYFHPKPPAGLVMRDLSR
jgi:uncharacterized protein (DUF1015 family)